MPLPEYEESAGILHPVRFAAGLGSAPESGDAADIYRVDGQLQKMKGLPLEAEKWANHPTAFFDEMKRLQQNRQQKKKL